MSTPIITLSKAQLAFGHHALLDQADLNILPNDRIGLIGRNGAGKSSLLKILDGRISLDDGEIQYQTGLRIETVEQEPELNEQQTIYDFICGDMQADEDWQRSARASSLIDKLNLDPDSMIHGLSGGTRKRVALARALVMQPDLLLLDEPTNHLDFLGIDWLQQELNKNNITLIIITHDRAFLDSVATRIIELDRGQLLSFPGNFSDWQKHKAEWLHAQELENARFDKFLSQEEVWIRKGIEARRTRNEGRVRRLEALRVERAHRRDQQGQVNFSLSQGQRSGKLVAELNNISYGYDGNVLIQDFSTLIQRGDRIGLIGPNGAGKTTLLKLILGQLEPQSGSIRLGVNLDIGYFDQMRASLDESQTLAETISPGSEWVEIGDQRKHVMSYLGDFLFSPARSHSPVASLSGGERARLALARMFAQSNNVLVLDEPTNDLDIETLELLESLLQDYPGTVLLVSHDRQFLDNVVTQTIVSMGDGKWQNHIGGYEDWFLDHYKEKATPVVKKSVPKITSAKATDDKPKKSKLAPWEAKELAELPNQISALETKQAELAKQLSAPETYAEGNDKSIKIQAELDQIAQQLNDLFDRWATLEEKETD